MTPFSLPHIPSIYYFLGGSLVTFIGWAYKAKRRSDINKNFIRDVATNHLPHIYHANRQFAEGLNRLLEKQGLDKIEFSEPPQIQFIELNGHDKH